jgi:hypothetical protein
LPRLLFWRFGRNGFTKHYIFHHLLDSLSKR